MYQYSIPGSTSTVVETRIYLGMYGMSSSIGKHIGNGPPPSEQIRPRLRRCLICTCPPPCKHLSLKEAQALLIEELEQYPINYGSEPCQDYFQSGQCCSLKHRGHCIYSHPPLNSPLVVLGTDCIDRPGHTRQYVPDAYEITPAVEDNHFSKLSRHKCQLCRLRMECKTHPNNVHLSQARKQHRDFTFAKSSENRCPLCTLLMPCSHFQSVEELRDARKQEEKHGARYPIQSTRGRPNCIHWVQSGNCAMYDSLGICMFWHPKNYGNKRVNLGPLISHDDRTSSIADYASFGREHFGIHGIDGFPGEHRSSGGVMKAGKTKLALEMYRQDSVNIAEARKRSQFPLNKETGKPNYAQWNFPSPPLCRNRGASNAQTRTNTKGSVKFSLKRLTNGSKDEEEDRAQRCKKRRAERKRLNLLRGTLQKAFWRMSEKE